MKICFVAPGEIEIPPNGWGALETVLWNQYQSLRELRQDVYYINEKNSQSAFEKVKEISPDFVHLHLGKHWEIMPHIPFKKIVTSHDGSFMQSKPFHERLIRNFFYDCIFFPLTSWEQDFILNIGISKHNCTIVPNGVSFSSFNRVPRDQVKNKSICLGKIDRRKRQHELQQMNLGIDFVGANTIPDFNEKDECFMGPWSRDQVFQNLTYYSNLILLSSSELQPLVCLEALASGLGLVISEAASQNLDTSLDFITVIPNSKLNDNAYVQSAIETNKILSQNSRESIIEYGKTFDWINIGKKYLEALSEHE
mgnify:CR=1 FL=1